MSSLSELRGHRTPDFPALPTHPWGLLLYYVQGRLWQFLGLGAVVVGAAGCAVAVQVGMKLLGAVSRQMKLGESRVVDLRQELADLVGTGEYPAKAGV